MDVLIGRPSSFNYIASIASMQTVVGGFVLDPTVQQGEA
jgi:hypothetical protein